MHLCLIRFVEQQHTAPSWMAALSSGRKSGGRQTLLVPELPSKPAASPDPVKPAVPIGKRPKIGVPTSIADINAAEFGTDEHANRSPARPKGGKPK